MINTFQIQFVNLMNDSSSNKTVYKHVVDDSNTRSLIVDILPWSVIDFKLLFSNGYLSFVIISTGMLYVDSIEYWINNVLFLLNNTPLSSLTYILFISAVILLMIFIN